MNLILKSSRQKVAAFVPNLPNTLLRIDLVCFATRSARSPCDAALTHACTTGTDVGTPWNEDSRARAFFGLWRVKVQDTHWSRQATTSARTKWGKAGLTRSP